MAKTEKIKSNCPSAIERLALRTIAFIILMIALILPIGVFSPFTAGEQILAGGAPPSIAGTLIWLIPLEIFLLAVIYLIDPRSSKNNKKSITL